MDRRVVKTKTAIRTAFTELLSQQELREITVTDIAEKAQINRKTFYAHYAGIFQVVDEIENNIVSDLRELLRGVDLNRCLKNPNEIFQKLTTIINNNINFYGDLLQMNKNANLIAKIVLEIKRMVKSSFYEQFHIDTLPVDVMSDFIISGMLSVFQNWFNSDRKQSIEELSRIISTLSTYGVNGLIAG